MINIFDHSLETPDVSCQQVINSLLIDIAKNESERLILDNFIFTNSLSGNIRLAEVITQAETISLEEPKPLLMKTPAIQHYLLQFKTSGEYERIVLKIISENPECKSVDTALQLLRGESPQLPGHFPGEPDGGSTGCGDCLP